MKAWHGGFAVCALALIGALLSARAPAQQGARGGDWPTYGGDLGHTKYSPLDQIDKANVGQLALAWRWASPDNQLVADDPRQTPWAFKSTPIMVEGVLYVSTSLNLVVALDAGTGAQRWVFDPLTREHGRPVNLGFNHRGVAFWRDGEDRRIFIGTNDAYLFALDARTGTPIESFGEGGKVDLTTGLRRPVDRGFYGVMSTPLVVGDNVIVGSSIHDGPTRKEMPPGDVRSFDARTGKQRWIFHSVPQPGELGNETWEAGSWEYTGNTNVWTLMSADPELGLVYLPFGTPTNDWYGGLRLGDDLFAESLVAVEADTGKHVWHFQMVHHGLWDYDLPAAPTLLDVTQNGQRVRAVAQISKQGFLYVFDRATGKPLWPIEERPVPQSTIPGERTSPTQPFPTRPAAFDRQGTTPDDLIDFSPELHQEALRILEGYEWGPLFTPPSLRGTLQVPGWGGGGNWWGAGVDPESGRIFIPSVTAPIKVALVEPDASRSDFRYVRGFDGRVEGPRGLPLLRPPYSRITAIDLNTGEHLWMVAHGDGPRQQVIDLGLPDPGPLGDAWSSTGPLVTKTLLFLGQGGRTGRSGTAGGKSALRAFDKDTGAVIHTVELAEPPSGTPMTYLFEGRQFIVLAVGGGKEQALLALTAVASPATPSGR